MSLRVKVIIDEDSLRDLEKDIEKKINNVIKREVKQIEINSVDTTKLDKLIDLLVDKDVIRRWEI